MDKQTSIETLIRVQPPLRSHLVIDQPYIIRCGTKGYVFDHIFNEDSSQNDVYLKVGTKIINNVKTGYNSCIFAYGQTGSGKTYTMTGDEHQEGLIQNCLRTLWSVLQEHEFYEITLSYYEIYNEQINDLLLQRKKDRIPIKLKQSMTLGFYAQNLTEITVEKSEDMINLLQKGIKNRAIADTKSNMISSRSHSILTLKILSRENRLKNTKSSKVHFIDLAGSEKQKSTETDGEKLKQASKINRSLTLLSIVIQKLANKASHIPYRDSLLTKILKDSLGGNSKTILLATISSKETYFSETLSTLNFASKARNIKLQAKINEIFDEINVENLLAKNKQLEEEIKSLKSKQKTCINCENLQKDYESLENKYDHLQSRLKETLQELQMVKTQSAMEITSLEKENDLKILEIQKIKVETDQSANRYGEFLLDFSSKVKKLKFNDFQDKLFLLQHKKIKQYEEKLKAQKRHWEHKQQIYQNHIHKLKTQSYKIESQDSQTPRTSASVVVNKRIQEELQGINIERKIEIQKREELEIINKNLLLKLEDLADSYDFISRKIQENEEFYQRELEAIRKEYEIEKFQRIKQYLQREKTPVQKQSTGLDEKQTSILTDFNTRLNIFLRMLRELLSNDEYVEIKDESMKTQLMTLMESISVNKSPNT